MNRDIIEAHVLNERDDKYLLKHCTVLQFGVTLVETVGTQEEPSFPHTLTDLP